MEKVILIEALSHHFARVQFKSGRIDTVSTHHLAPSPGVEQLFYETNDLEEFFEKKPMEKDVHESNDKYGFSQNELTQEVLKPCHNSENSPTIKTPEEIALHNESQEPIMEPMAVENQQEDDKNNPEETGSYRTRYGREVKPVNKFP